jgi:hypothetical protein
MARGSQRSDKTHNSNKNRQNPTGSPDPERQAWGGQKPIITGALGQVKYASAPKTEKTKRAA